MSRAFGNKRNFFSSVVTTSGVVTNFHWEGIEMLCNSWGKPSNKESFHQNAMKHVLRGCSHYSKALSWNFPEKVYKLEGCPISGAQGRRWVVSRPPGDLPSFCQSVLSLRTIPPPSTRPQQVFPLQTGQCFLQATG